MPVDCDRQRIEPIQLLVLHHRNSPQGSQTGSVDPVGDLVFQRLKLRFCLPRIRTAQGLLLRGVSTDSQRQP